MIEAIAACPDREEAIVHAVDGVARLGDGEVACVAEEPGLTLGSGWTGFAVGAGHRLIVGHGSSSQHAAARAAAAILRMQARSEAPSGATEPPHVEAIRFVASGIAHEVNNPLAAVLANLELATRQVGEELRKRASYSWLDDLHGELDDARIAAERIHQLVRRLKVLGHSPASRDSAQLDRVLDNVLQLVGRALRQKGRLHRTSQAPLQVAASAHHGTHAMLALLLHVLRVLPRASDSSSTITISTSTEVGFGRMTVRHEGPSKVAAAPESLGVACFLAQALGGSVGEHLGDGGSLWSLTLPVAAPASGPVVPRQTQHVARILVIDDEPLIGKVVRRMLSEHEVHIATSGTDGLARASQEAWDLILLDLHLPDLSGQDLYQALVERAPSRADRVAFTTGGATDSSQLAFVRDHVNHCLAKPFDQQALRTLVRALVAPLSS